MLRYFLIIEGSTSTGEDINDMMMIFQNLMMILFYPVVSLMSSVLDLLLVEGDASTIFLRSFNSNLK